MQIADCALRLALTAEGIGTLQRGRVGDAWQPSGGNCAYPHLTILSARPSESSKLDLRRGPIEARESPHPCEEAQAHLQLFSFFGREPVALSRKTNTIFPPPVFCPHHAMQVQRSRHQVVPESLRGGLASIAETCRLMRDYFVLCQAWRSPSPASPSL